MTTRTASELTDQIADAARRLRALREELIHLLPQDLAGRIEQTLRDAGVRNPQQRPEVFRGTRNSMLASMEDAEGYLTMTGSDIHSIQQIVKKALGNDEPVAFRRN